MKILSNREWERVKILIERNSLFKDFIEIQKQRERTGYSTANIHQIEDIYIYELWDVAKNNIQNGKKVNMFG